MTIFGGALAGLVAGWVCFLAGHWLGVVGLPTVDLAAMGRRYLDAPVGGWIFGLFHHLANSCLLGALYAFLLFEWRPDGVEFVAGVALGLIAGVVIWAGLAMSVVVPGSGRGWFGSRLDDRRLVISNLVVHLVFGAMLGAIIR